MATLTVQAISRAGLEPTLQAAASGGDQFANTGREFVRIDNGGGSAVTVTVTTPQTVDGLAVADRTVSVPAGETRLVGPFPTANYNDASGRVQLAYSGVTSVTVAALHLPAAT